MDGLAKGTIVHGRSYHSPINRNGSSSAFDSRPLLDGKASAGLLSGQG